MVGCFKNLAKTYVEMCQKCQNLYFCKDLMKIHVFAWGHNVSELTLWSHHHRNSWEMSCPRKVKSHHTKGTFFQLFYINNNIDPCVFLYILDEMSHSMALKVHCGTFHPKYCWSLLKNLSKYTKTNVSLHVRFSSKSILWLLTENILVFFCLAI